MAHFFEQIITRLFELKAPTVFIVSVVIITILGVIAFVCFIRSRKIDGLLRKKDELEGKVSALQAVLKELGKSKAELVGENSQIKTDIDRLKGERETLNERIRAARNDKSLTDWENKKNELKEEIQKIADDGKKKEAARQKAEKELNETLKKFGEEKSKLDEIQKQLGAKTQAVDALDSDKKNREEEIKKLSETQKTLLDEISKKQSEAATLQEEIEKRKTEVKNLDEKKTDFEKRLAELKEEIEKAEKELADLNEKVAMLRERVLEAASRAEVIEEIKKSREDEIKKLNETVKTLSDEISKKQNEIMKLQDRFDKRRTEMKNLDEEKTTLEGKIKKLEKEREELKEENEKMKKNTNELEKNIKELRKEASTLMGQIELDAEAKKHVWKELETPVEDQFKGKIKIDKTSETKWLTTFNNNLSDAGFQFDERRIKAFHTSLKCADISPLTVLSGVSGTGKSLLPQLYAQAAGMHFTILPVQPRWDNPSDLFGFYNYIERKFKATELSRIFYEMETKNKGEKEEATFPMHIVLLDEMNLARVEYYFSDFLSKLETRRVDKTKAKILLECAGSGTEAKAVYPWKNVLFVGTMNEDETTQTLSDKVIDRSNVLRFGAPRSFAAKTADTTKFTDEYRELGARTYGAWKSWQKTSDSLKNSNVLEDALGKINESLQKMERAFGHRVSQAVVSYVANYPEVSVFDINNEACKNAVSDAIEMKIFPKMNGLDKTDPEWKTVRDSVAKAISGIVDADLIKAFERAADSDNSSSPFFKWKGMQR